MKYVSNKKNKNKNAFTLIEVIIAIMLIGIAIASIVSTNGYLTKVNAMGVELSTAEFLIEQIREKTAVINFDDTLDLNGQLYCPAQDSQGQPMSDFADYTQKITVVHVQNGNLTEIDSTGSSNYIRITVDILHNNSAISNGSWIKADY